MRALSRVIHPGRVAGLIGMALLALTYCVVSIAVVGVGAASASFSPDLSPVSCVSSSFCIVSDNAGNVYAWDGTSWSLDPVQGSTVEMDGVSCSSTTFCQLVDNSGDVTTWNGTSWAGPTSIDSDPLDAVSCFSSSICAAVDADGDVLTYNGSMWTSPSDEDGTNALAGVSCTSSTFCLAVDDVGNFLTYNSGTWSGASSFESGAPVGVSCTSSSFCVAVDVSGNESTYNGSTWSSSLIDSGNAFDSISCASSSFCVAVDGDGNAVTYNGSTWSSAAAEASVVLISISCTSSSFCMATDNSSNYLTYNGSSWSVAAIFTHPVISGVSCLSSTFCALVDQNNQLITSPDLFTPGSETTYSISGTPNGISCLSSSFCAVVGARKGTIWTGGSPAFTTTSNIVASGHTLQGVSCVSVSSAEKCWAVDNKGDGVEYDSSQTGAGWTNGWNNTPVAFDSAATPSLTSVSCNASGTSWSCTAVDADGNVFTWLSGGSWSSAIAITGAPDLVSVSCQSYDADCVAISVQDAYATTNYWSTNSNESLGTAFVAVSCVSTSDCAAINSSDTNGNVTFTTDDSTTSWSTQHLASHGTPTDLSCWTTGGSCVAPSNGGWTCNTTDYFQTTRACVKGDGG